MERERERVLGVSLRASTLVSDIGCPERLRLILLSTILGILLGTQSLSISRGEWSDTPKGPMVQVVLGVPHLEAMEITVEGVLLVLHSRSIRILVVLQLATDHVVLTHVSYLSVTTSIDFISCSSCSRFFKQIFTFSATVIEPPASLEKDFFECADLSHIKRDCPRLLCAVYHVRSSSP